MMRRKEKLQGSFPETLQKDVLRERDLTLVQRLATKKNRRLRYCGLCGVEAVDVVKWQDALDRVLVVERPISDEGIRINFKASIVLKLAPLFNGNIQIIFQDVWDFFASPKFVQSKMFPDIINLDFCGGMVNEVAMEYPKQRVAFQRVFEVGSKQGEDFLLLLTLMPRDRGKSTYKKYLQDTIESIGKQTPTSDRERFLKQVESSRKFHERNNFGLFKACLPLLLEEIGRSHNFSVKPVYIRLYTKMIHFAFECAFVSGVLGLPSDPTRAIRLLNQPMRRLLPDGREEQDWPPQITVE